MRAAALVVALSIGACTRSPASASRDHASGKSVAELQLAACVGDKGVENIALAKDGKCLCYDPPWEGGVPPPLRNADCLYVGADMKTLIHARCDKEQWREVPQAEIDQQRMMRQ